MSLLCAFVVPGQPIPKARPRVLPGGHTFTPPRTAQAEARVAQHLFVSSPRLRPTASRVSVELTFYFKGAQIGDWDNLAKLVCDALNGKAWVDDKQVRRAEVEVIDHDDDPRTCIEVWADD